MQSFLIVTFAVLVVIHTFVAMHSWGKTEDSAKSANDAKLEVYRFVAQERQKPKKITLVLEPLQVTLNKPPKEVGRGKSALLPEATLPPTLNLADNAFNKAKNQEFRAAGEQIRSHVRAAVKNAVKEETGVLIHPLPRGKA